MYWIGGLFGVAWGDLQSTKYRFSEIIFLFEVAWGDIDVVTKDS